MKRKTLALLLCVVLMLSVLPLTGAAADPAEGPVVSLTADVEESAILYPGDTFAVSVTAENAAGYSGYVRVAFNVDEVSLVGCTFAENAQSTAEDGGEISVLLVNIPSDGETLATITLQVDNVMEDGTTNVSILETQFISADGAMSGDAGEAALEPASGNLGVNVSAGWTVTFVDENDEEVDEPQTILPSDGQAYVPSMNAAPEGYLFEGWVNVDDENDFVPAGAESAAVTGPTTYKAVYGLDIAIAQDVDYIGGYVRIVVSGKLNSYTFRYGDEAPAEMYKLGEETFAYIYKPTSGVIDLGNPDSNDYAVKQAAARKLFAEKNALTAANDLSGRQGNALYDVNGTGVFDLADVRAVYNCANAASINSIDFGSYVPTLLRADLTADAKVDAADVDFIINRMLGIDIPVDEPTNP